MNIPEEAIEAAAKEAFWADDEGGHIGGGWTWDTIPEVGRNNYRKLVRAVIQTAAPFIAAQALLDAAEDLEYGNPMREMLAHRAATIEAGN